MNKIRIKVEELGKLYKLGEVGTGTLSQDLSRWWAKIRGKQDPFSIIGEENDRTIRSQEDFVWALKDINFSVKEGEVLGIIGYNGAGKSTLLKVLSKVTGPTTGQIKIQGRIGALLEVGTGMHPELTGIENIYLNGAILGMTKKEIENKIVDIIDFAGIAKYADTPFKRYSSGMRVRLGFAVAAFLEPEILIVDEVLAVGDIEFQKKAIGKMQEISKGQGRTVLFVSHNLASVKSLCTRSLLLEKGKIKAIGDTDEIINKYISSTNTEEKNSFKDRTDRIGNGRLKILNIEFLNDKGENIKTCFGGDSILISFEFDRSINDNEKVILAFSFMDSWGNIVVLWSTDELTSRVTLDERKLYFKIENLNLRSSIYNLSYQLGIDSLTDKNTTDMLKNIKSIQVLAKKFKSDGAIPRKLAMTYIPISICKNDSIPS